MGARFLSANLLALLAVTIGCTSADFGTAQDENDTGVEADDGVGDTSRADVVGTDTSPRDGIVSDVVPFDGIAPDSLPPIDGGPPACPTGDKFTRTSYPVGNNPSAIVAGDLDGNATIDLVVANGGGGTITVMLGKGDGKFETQPQQAIGAIPSDLVLTDLDGDKNVDIAATVLGGNAVGILQGNGTGKFGTVVPVAVGANPTALVAAQLNGDTRMDLVVTAAGSNQLQTLIAAAAGAAFSYDVKSTGAGINPTDVAPVDVNKDGVMDFVVVNGGGDSLSLFLMKSDGSVGSTASVYGSMTGPRHIATGDFNTDGRIDLAVTNESSASLVIFPATGTGTYYGVAKSYPLPLSKPSGIVATDLDGDGHLDAVAGSNEAIALLDVGSLSPSTVKVSVPGSAIATADFNGDGKPDLATTNGGANAVMVLLACH